MDGFRSLGLANWLCRQVELVGFKEPAEVQKRCIPPILKGMLTSSNNNRILYYSDILTIYSLKLQGKIVLHVLRLAAGKQQHSHYLFCTNFLKIPMEYSLLF